MSTFASAAHVLFTHDIFQGFRGFVANEAGMQLEKRIKLKKDTNTYVQYSTLVNYSVSFADLHLYYEANVT